MRALGAGLAAGVLSVAFTTSPVAQPARATELSDAAEAAMAGGRYDAAATAYGEAYDLTQDPLLLFKIATANDQAGKCDLAVGDYARYLREAPPSPKLAALADERIAACAGVVWSTDSAGSAEGSAVGSAGSATPAPAPEPPTPPPPPPIPRRHGNDAAWLAVGGSLAFVTVGAVLAYAASSSEQDLRDLYVGLGNTPPTYDAKTAKRYQDLLDEGHRYQHLSWGSFGIAAGFAIGATILFVRGDVAIAPVVTPHEAGAAATVRF